MNSERVAQTFERGGDESSQPSREQYQRLGSDAMRQKEPGPTAKKLLEQRPPTALTLETFAGVYPNAKLRRDQAYVDRLDEMFDRDPDSGKAAKSFEKLFIYGVQTGAWLGNLPGADGHPPFITKTFESTKYDDYRHRVDSFTTIKFAEKIQTETGTLKGLPLAFDVTINSSREKIMDKLTRCYNDGAELPFGFTHLDYYTNGRTAGECEILPRYVIGVDSSEAQELSEQFTRRMADGRPSPIKLLSAQNLYARFMVLSEIRAQNMLFQAMLPDDAYDSPDIKMKKACAYLEATDNQLNTALLICANEMVQRRCLPTEVLEKIERDGKAQSTRKTIEDYMLKSRHENFVERQREYARRNGTIFDPNAGEDDTYVQIVTCARELEQATYDETSYPEVAARRRMMAQNQKLELGDAEPERRSA